MKIINRQQFLLMPEGTYYRKYYPIDLCGELFIKGESLKDDWYELDMLGIEDYNEFIDSGPDLTKEYKTDPIAGGRDGLYEQDQLFAVYSKREVQNLLAELIKMI